MDDKFPKTAKGIMAKYPVFIEKIQNGWSMRSLLGYAIDWTRVPGVVVSENKNYHFHRMKQPTLAQFETALKYTIVLCNCEKCRVRAVTAFIKDLNITKYQSKWRDDGLRHIGLQKD